MSTISVDDWKNALQSVGVNGPTLRLWAPACAEELDPAKFSRGMDDVLALLPQVLHECDRFDRMEENLYYSPERLMVVWPTRFPTHAEAIRFSNNPQALAEKVYGGRMGNVVPGWAYLYRGQGPIMFTGRSAFEYLEKVSDGTGAYQDYTVSPWVVCQPRLGLAATRAWWEGLIPDGCLSDQVQIRRRVNGGKIGLEHCLALADSCKRAFA